MGRSRRIKQMRYGNLSSAGTGWRFVPVKFAIFLLFVSVMSAGCYTVLRHPPVEREKYLPSEITHRDACNSCHQGFGLFSYRNPGEVPYYPERFEDWNFYYTYPWWLDDVYYSLSGAEKSETETPLPIDPRRLNTRRGIDGYAPNTVPAPAGPGIQMRKQAAGQDSLQAKERKRKHAPGKPKTDRSRLKSPKERKRKKK